MTSKALKVLLGITLAFSLTGFSCSAPRRVSYTPPSQPSTPSPPLPPQIRSLTGAFRHPQGVAAEGGTVYVADTDNNRLLEITNGNTLSLLAGDGVPGFSGDGGLATAARIHHPTDLVADASGNVFFTDTENNRVRQIDSMGIISTVAGTGERGFAGDGGPATAAVLFEPTGLARDPASGDLYVVDARNNRVRRFSVGGTISTVAGNGVPGFSGDGGAATQAELRFAGSYFRLGDVAVDSDYVYIADSGNHCIRRIDSWGMISRIAGQGSFGAGGDSGPALDAGMAYPSGIAVRAPGILLVSDMANSNVRQVRTSTQTIWHVAGTSVPGFTGDGSSAEEASLHAPAGLAVSLGEIFVADVENNRIRVIK